MLVCIADVLSLNQLKKIRAAMNDGSFLDGKKTAGFRAKRVKNNEQLGRDHPQRDEIDKLVTEALYGNAEFQRCVLPQSIQRPLFSRYREGMAYGLHVDDALMGGRSAQSNGKGGKWRTDVSVTLFLNQPTDYSGGELEFESSFGPQSVKLPAGWAVTYPSSTLHRVAPVTRGERLAAVTWAQSHVREADRRELLHDLDKIRLKLDELAPGAAETNLAFKTYANLLRRWSEC